MSAPGEAGAQARDPARARVGDGRLRLALLPPLLAFLAAGLLGAYRYVDNFWVYRGYSPARDPAYVQVHGTEEQISVRSAAIGGRAQPVVVYLPPGYAVQKNRRYPVMYLLHGFPGKPDVFLHVLRMGVLVDSLVAKGRMGGMILVAPFGSTGTFTDKEWANGFRRNEGWETFVARDVVNEIDARYRTVAAGSGRAIAGLSEGGYGALNIAFHHPKEFRVAESWSGYMAADNIPAIFGGRDVLLAYNSPATYLPAVAPVLRRNSFYVWFYTGSSDPLRVKNQAFAAELARYRIHHFYRLDPGGHTWRIWRTNAENAILAAAARLTNG